MNAAKRREKVRAFWEREFVRIGESPTGAHSDPFTVELENWFIEKYLRRLKVRRAIEIGCGNGQRTAHFSRFVKDEMLGVDYSKNAVELARRLENKKLHFERWDMEDTLRWTNAFDCVIICRVLINLQTRKAQLRAIKTIDSLLKASGTLILCECSEQGHRSLNKLRTQVGLHPIKTAWHNVNIDESTFLRELKRMFRVRQMTRFGLYYVLTRVVHPLIVAPKEPKPTSEINRTSAKLQIRLYSAAKGLELYGRHLAIVASKL